MSRRVAEYLMAPGGDYMDSLQESYFKDPSSVDESWRYFFEGWEVAQEGNPMPPPAALVESSSSPPPLQEKLTALREAYRSKGFLAAHLNPLESPPPLPLALQPSAFQLLESESVSQTSFIDLLKRVYTKTQGIEISHLQSSEEKEFLFQALEQAPSSLPPEKQKAILKRLTHSEGFEHFLHTRYVAQKRFSLEGAEVLLPVLDTLLEEGSHQEAQEFVLGMAHRGRLNVLTHLFGKKPDLVFTEFEGKYSASSDLGEGDVKYHMGYSADCIMESGKAVHLSLASNPSHLEFVNPVILGITKAKQFQRQDVLKKEVIPIAIHGDAAFAGQGICYESLNLSQLSGYGVGGTLHLILNNQIGFTTNPIDSRSTRFCTDLAKMLDSPIFHVNGDDPEAACFLAQLSVAYRQKFKKDVFLEIVCYRKHGHNEADEPAFTQPLLYQKIKNHPSTRTIYAQKLVEQGILSASEAQSWGDQYAEHLVQAQNKTRAENPKPFISVFEGRWKGYQRALDESNAFERIEKTQVLEAFLKKLAKPLYQVPNSFHVHPKLQKIFESRLQLIEKEGDLDWGTGEALAFASILAQGISVRLSGQDVERGTFSHRHAVWNDVETGKTWTPLQNLGIPEAGAFQVCNSSLSEAAVLGFEYGYSLAEPDSLVIWEAQFGDFSNGAQVILDQFISTSESKWQRMTGLVLLLPHGYEGQGPEHSSARIERYLQLCGRFNQSVCYPSTPSQLFHLLRRQVFRKFRKPLIIFSPKSLLRHPLAVSPLRDFSEAGFQEVLEDSTWASQSTQEKAGVKQVILCSGKVYYDLVTYRKQKNLSSVPILRIEQLYPFPKESLRKILEQYPQASLRWVQEEPRNMGGWGFVFQQWSGGLDLFQTQVQDRPLSFVGRDWAAAPSVGSQKVHEKQLESLLEKAFL